MSEEKLPDLIAEASEALSKQGYNGNMVRKYRNVWKKLQVFAKRYRLEKFSWELACFFLREEFDIEMDDDDIYTRDSVTMYGMMVRPLLMLLLLQNKSRVVRKQKLTVMDIARFHAVTERFIAVCREQNNRQSTIHSKMWTIKPFLIYLQQCGIEDTDALKTLNKEAIAGFTKFLTSRGVNTISDKIGVLRIFLRFLYEEQFVTQDFSVYVPKVPGRPKKLAHTWTSDELMRILNAIERGTSVGKRDYAVFMLVSHLGLRTGDIVNLTFDNLNWAKCRIQLMQDKTGNPLELPLSEELGKTIIDYLKYGRPKSASQYVFVRHSPPYGKITDLWYPMQKYLREAKISIVKEKPHGLHTFRFTLATRMLDEEVDLETIAAVLGHADPASTLVYLRADIKKLRECALNPDEVFNNA